MSKFRYATLAFSALCAIALSSPVWAQKTGNYSGTSADGETLSFTVGLDGNNDLAVTGASISFMAPCKGGTAPTLTSGWGIALDAVITNHKGKFVAPDPYFYITGDMTFSGSRMTGLITTRSPYLDPGHTPPLKADYCESPVQAYTATYTGPASRLPTLPAGTAIHLPTPAQH